MIEYLEKLNPWWFEEEDNDISMWKNLKFKTVPNWIEKVVLEPFSLNFVIGPRRVGKTIGIKLLIYKLINSGVVPNDIVYLNVDLIPDLEFFQEILNFIAEKEFKYIFIDEATSLENWWRPLKGFIDAGLFKNSVITVSGSITLEVKKHAELFPGRTGHGNKIEVLPLSFPEYLSMFTEKRKKSEIRNIFNKYTITGGFLGALNFGDSFMQQLISAIESEVLKIGMNIKLLFEIVSSLLTKIPSALSYQSIARDIGVDYKTVRHYLELLENMYLIKISYWKQGKEVSFKKEKKVFFRDPFILRAFSFWTGEKFLESALYENIVQEHLYRKFGEIYYYRNSYEIDCIAGDLKVEVKAGKPHRKYPKDVIVLEEEDIPKFLIELF